MQHKARWTDVFRNGLAIYTVTINLAMALHAIDVFIISTVMPKVVRDIGGTSFYTWPTMLYMVASIVGAASGNPLKAISGTRRAYILASLIFLLGSVGCASAPSMLVMLIARTVQGWGGGLLISLSMAMVQEVYPEPMRKRALAIISTTWGIAALIGPAIGGWFAEAGWWRGAFWFNAPVVIIFLIGAWAKLPRHGATGVPPRFPYRRLGLLSLGVIAVSCAGQVHELLGQFNLGIASAGQLYVLMIQAALVVFAVLLVRLTISMDRTSSASRLLPSKPFSLTTTTGIGGWAMFLSSMTHTVIGAYLPLALQTLRGASDEIAGYIMAALAVSWTVSSVLTSGFQETGSRRCICIGLVLSVVGMIGVTLTLAEGSLITITLLNALVGFGLGTTNLHLVAATMRHATPGEEAITAGSIPTIRSLGISFGAAAAGVIANSAGLTNALDAAQVAHAIHWVLALGCVLPALACLFSLLFVRLARRAPETPRAEATEQVLLID
jgi:MFS family permease